MSKIAIETSLIAIDRHRLTQTQLEWDETLEAVRELPCETHEQETWWADLLPRLQATINDLEEERVALKRPLLDDGILVDTAYRVASAPALELKALVLGKLQAAEVARQRLQEAREAEIRALVASGDTEAAQAALDLVPEATKVVGVATVWVWEIEVVDPTLVPDSFKVVDEKALKAYSKKFPPSEAAVPAVPGVVFKKVPTKRGSNRGGK